MIKNKRTLRKGLFNVPLSRMKRQPVRCMFGAIMANRCIASHSGVSGLFKELATLKLKIFDNSDVIIDDL